MKLQIGTKLYLGFGAAFFVLCCAALAHGYIVPA